MVQVREVLNRFENFCTDTWSFVEVRDISNVQKLGQFPPPNELTVVQARGVPYRFGEFCKSSRSVVQDAGSFV